MSKGFQESGTERGQQRTTRWILLTTVWLGLGGLSWLCAAASKIGESHRIETIPSRPALSYSTYLGGSGAETPAGIAVDAGGNVYVAGSTDSVDFPVKHSGPGLLSGGSFGGRDVFVAKLNGKTGALVYSVYLGGSGDDRALGIAVDLSGNAFVMGETSSANFPVTSGAYQKSLRGAKDLFVAKLNPQGNDLIYSTYLGGSATSDGEGQTGAIAVDASGYAYLTGSTDSSDFPTTSETFQPSFGRGTSDAFVTKLSIDGDRLMYSSYLGGTGLDEGHSIAVDPAGNCYVTGRTRSRDFPTVNGFQSARSGEADDAFVVRVNRSGSFLTYATYLGGRENDEGRGIVVDSEGHVYVTGQTVSRDFPVTTDSYKDEHLETDSDAFVVKLDTTEAGSKSFVYGTFIGGTGDDFGRAIGLTPAGNVYVTGITHSSDFPVMDPVQAQIEVESRENVFVTKLNTKGDKSVYSTTLGGSLADSGLAIALDPTGHCWVTGVTSSSDFPLESPAQPLLAGKNDGFVVRISDGDGSASQLVITSGVSINPIGPTYTVGQEIIAEFTVTNRGGSTLRINELLFAETDPNNDVPGFTPETDPIYLEAGASFDYEGRLTLTQVGMFRFQVAYRNAQGEWHTDLPVEEEGLNSLDIAVQKSSSTETPENRISSSSENDQCMIPFGGNVCSTILTWTSINISKDEDVQVWVEDVGIGAGKSLFASARSGSAVAEWIQATPHRYRFTLNDARGGRLIELGSVEVTGSELDPTEPSQTISAIPQHCQIVQGESICTSKIEWNTSDEVPDAEVFVEDVGVNSSPSLFAGGLSGAYDAPWIQGPPHRYRFTLYSVSFGVRRLLSAVEVTGRNGTSSNASGQLFTSVNPCQIGADGSPCSTVIRWTTADHVPDARVVVVDVGKGGRPLLLGRGKSGSATLERIDAEPHVYVVTLYEIRSRNLVTLDTLIVTAKF